MTSVRLRWHFAIILAVCLLSFFSRLGASKLWDRDEPRNARCAAEMIERGDWIVPTFNGELRTHKPILLYWFMMTSFSVFGENEFAARFWSATLATGTVGITYWLGCYLFDRRTAFWSALVLATTFMFTVAARAATPDATLVFFTTLTIAALAHATSFGQNASPRNQRVGTSDARGDTIHRPTVARGPFIWLGYAAMACAVLAKGPVGCVLPLTVWACFLFWRQNGQQGMLASAANAANAVGRTEEGCGLRAELQQRLTRLRPRLTTDHWICVLRELRLPTAAAALTLIAVPWYWLVGIRTGGVWLQEFFFEHNVGRALQTMEGHGGNSMLYYPVAILVGFFPWSMLAVPIILWVRDRSRDGLPDSDRLLLIWMATYIGAFSMASTKLPNYVTPIYPALALVTGHLIAHWATTRVAPNLAWTRAAAACLALTGAVMLAVLPFVIRDQGSLGGRSQAGVTWLAAVGFIPLLGGIAAFRSFQRAEWQAGFARFAITATTWGVAVFAVASPRVSRHQQFTELIAGEANGATSNWASVGVHEPSWIFYAQRTIPFLTVDRFADARNVLTSPSGRIITSATLFHERKNELPANTQILANVPYFLKHDRLVLLGVASTTDDTQEPVASEASLRDAAAVR